MKSQNSDKASSLEIEEMVLEIIADHFGLPAPALSLDSHIMNDCGADSLDQMELFMTVEELFAIHVPDDEIIKIITIADIVTTITNMKPTITDLALAKHAWSIASRRKS